MATTADDLEQQGQGDPAEAVGGPESAAGGQATPEPPDELDGPQEGNGELDGDDNGAGDDDDDQEDGPTQAQIDAYALVQARSKALDKLETYIGKKLVEIFGQEDADALELCELCHYTGTFGWRIPGHPPEQVRDAVLVAIGYGTIDTLREFPAFQTCQVCDGWRYVKTGARTGTEMTRLCPSCKGRGYTSSLPEDANRPAAELQPIVAEQLENGGPAMLPATDTFGTPIGHPDYGKMPQFREVPISHWQHDAAPAAA